MASSIVNAVRMRLAGFCSHDNEDGFSAIFHIFPFTTSPEELLAGIGDLLRIAQNNTAFLSVPAQKGGIWI